MLLKFVSGLQDNSKHHSITMFAMSNFYEVQHKLYDEFISVKGEAAMSWNQQNIITAIILS